MRKSHSKRLWQVRIKETSKSEPLMRCRKSMDSIKTVMLADHRDESRGNLFTAWMVLGIKAA